MTLLLWESPPKEQKGELGVSQHCWPSFCLSGQILKWLVHSWALVLKLGAALAHREPPHTSTSSERSPTHSLSGQRKRAWQGLRQVSDDVIISLSHHLLIIQNTVSHLHLSQPGVCPEEVYIDNLCSQQGFSELGGSFRILLRASTCHERVAGDNTAADIADLDLSSCNVVGVYITPVRRPLLIVIFPM